VPCLACAMFWLCHVLAVPCLACAMFWLCHVLSWQRRRSIFLLLVSYRARCRVCCTFLARDVMSSPLYLSSGRRGVQVVSYFFGFSVLPLQRSLLSLWSVTNVRRLSCQMMLLLSCNQNRSAWIDCSKNSKYEISRKKSGGNCIVPCAWVEDRAGGMVDTRTRTHIHASVHADTHTHTY
jgi:hypothetical protein